MTISLGIARIIAGSHYHPDTLFRAGDIAVYAARQAVCDRYHLSAEFNFK